MGMFDFINNAKQNVQGANSKSVNAVNDMDNGYGNNQPAVVLGTAQNRNQGSSYIAPPAPQVTFTPQQERFHQDFNRVQRNQMLSEKARDPYLQSDMKRSVSGYPQGQQQAIANMFAGPQQRLGTQGAMIGGSTIPQDQGQDTGYSRGAPSSYYSR